MKVRQMAFLSVLAVGGCTAPCQSVQVHQWTRAEQEQIAIEHNALAKDDVLRGVMDEWEKLRAQAR